MNLTRRGAFGAAIGGAISAPEAAKQAVHTLSKAQLPSDMIKYQSIETGKDYPSEINLLEQAKKHKEYINQLTKISKGDFSGCWQERDLENSIESLAKQLAQANINSLKSVSGNYKLQMEQDRYIKDLKKDWMESAKRELVNFLKVKL